MSVADVVHLAQPCGEHPVVVARLASMSGVDALGIVVEHVL